MGSRVLTPEKLAEELLAMSRKAAHVTQVLSRLGPRDVAIGASAKDAVYRDGPMVLYRYRRLIDAEQVHPVPVLICYALVNRPYMIDLQENRSLVRNLLQRGLDVYLIDWGYPQRNDRWLTLEDYILGYLGGCVDYVRETHGLSAINLLGICQGGVFSMCFSALRPDAVQNLITMVAPVDFHVPDGVLNAWMGSGTGASPVDADLMVEALGNIPGALMNLGFLMLKPFALSLQKYVSFLDLLESDESVASFVRMETWITDSPDQVGEAWRQFIRDLYIDNKLIRGELVLGGRRVALGNITMPVLNLYAEQDHLVPPSSSRVLGRYIGSTDYTMEGFPVGHIGMYVSGGIQHRLPPAIVDWLKQRSETEPAPGGAARVH